MPNGASLESAGVTPDELMLPNPSELANHRDPVIADAITLGGAEMSPEDA
jgi:C-terminal processing protease CtpA/Prc